MPPKAAGFLLVAFVVIVFLFVRAVIRNRRQIIATADKAAVTSLAAGIKAKRHISGSVSRYAERVRKEAEKD